jgi:hypothetical protein
LVTASRQAMRSVSVDFWARAGPGKAARSAVARAMPNIARIRAIRPSVSGC